MSKQLQIVFDCPICGKETKALVWESLNIEFNPELKEKLLDGSLFQVKCNHCGRFVYVEYPLLYHDMEKKIMIHCDPALRDNALADSFAKGLAESYIRDYKQRFVLNSRELAEKVRIFDAGFDDRIIEIMKIFVFNQLSESENFDEADVLFDIMPDNSYSFAFVFPDGEIKESAFMQELYDVAENTYGEDLKGNRDVRIDNDWANDFVMLMEEKRKRLDGGQTE